jgi:hypothetical protein
MPWWITYRVKENECDPTDQPVRVFGEKPLIKKLNQTCYVKHLNGARAFMVNGDKIWKYFKLFNVGQNKVVQMSSDKYIKRKKDDRVGPRHSSGG